MIFPFDLTIEPSEAEFITDCEICCRPMNVVVRVSNGEIESVDVSPA